LLLLLLDHFGLEDAEQVVHVILLFGDGLLECVEILLHEIDFALVMLCCFGAGLFYIVPCANVDDDVVGIGEAARNVERVG